MIEVSRLNISMRLLKLISEIDEFKGKWNAQNLVESESLKYLRKISTIESIGSSNRIEGNKLSNIDVKTVLENIKSQSFKSRDEAEVAGYAELISTIYDNYEYIPFSESYLKQLHKILLNNVAKDAQHCGEYKKISNVVTAFDAEGNTIGVIFNTATPFDTPRMMEELVNWVNKALEEKFLHPLIIIGIFVVNFLAIHPFQDGNGRLSRALTMLLLLKNRYTYICYSSIESIIEASKDSYYISLRNTQENIWNNDVDYNPWLEFFIVSLHKQKLHLEEKIMSIEKNADLSEKAITVLNLFLENDKLTSTKIVQQTSFNIETVRKILQKLLQRGDIKKYGTTKTRYYQRF